MRHFAAFVRKEFRHIFRDRWTMIILLVLPVVMLVLFGYALNTEVRNTEIAVYDPSRDPATERLTDLLSRSEYFRVTRILSSPGEIDAVFRAGRIGLVVAFSENFYADLLHTGDAQVQLVADGTDPNTALTLTNYASGIINSFRQELTGTDSVPYAIDAETRLLYNPEMRSSYNFVPGVMGMVLMLICAMMTSISIAREKETGTMEVLLVSPMEPILIILAKTVPYLVISCVNLATILVLAVFVLGVPIAGSLTALIVVSLLFIFVALALGLLISSVTDSQLVALLLSGMGLMMPVVILSGMIFPVENMPVFLQALANVLPAKWYISAVRKLMIKGLGFSSIPGELLVLGFMAVALVAVSLKKFKIRLE
jgi:ABC-type multidrug transport system, permease component